MERIGRFINNKSIKTKTVYLYLFCVLIPIFATNAYILYHVATAAREEERREVNGIADAEAQYMTDSLESALYLSYDLYSNFTVNDFLDTQYESKVAYFESYLAIFDNYSFYAGTRQIVNSLTLYSDNPTMLNGGNYFRIDAVQEEEWYRQFMESGSDMLVCAYFHDTKSPDFRKRTLSFIRRLDYMGRSDIEKLVKIDLNYELMNDYVAKLASDTLVYIADEGRILFTNDSHCQNRKEGYAVNFLENARDIQAKKSFMFGEKDFTVYVRGYKTNYSRILRENLWMLLLLLAADALLPAIVINVLGNSITKRVLILGKYLEHAKNEVFEPLQESGARDEIGELERNYNRMVTRIKELLETEIRNRLEQQELEIARQQAELLALHSQINPHFLFNVLESIRLQSVLKGETQTADMVECLARLMRKSAEWGSDLISIRQEAEFTEAYLKLQQYRFGEAFGYKTEVDPDCAEFLIPSLSIVTFAENACVHGLNREGHSGSVFVSAYREGSVICIDVEDTGVGMEEERARELEARMERADVGELKQTGSLGMLNVSIRIRKYYGDRAKIQIESEKRSGTCVMIRIPAGEEPGGYDGVECKRGRTV